MSEQPRVPLPTEAPLIGVIRTIQVNHCRMPDCENFGVPASPTHSKPGRPQGRDPHYQRGSGRRGTLPAVICKACRDKPPIKSNAGIVAEIDRLTDADGLLRLEETTGCRNEDCENHGLPVAFHPRRYRKNGKSAGYGQRYQCKGCNSYLLLSRPVRLHDNHKRLAVDVFSRLANKAPIRGIARGSRLESTSSYYDILTFIHDRCRTYSGAVDRALMDGKFRLPADMNIESDAQVYMLNWPSRLDRRNIELSSYCTVDADTRFILGMHSNFDDRVDPFFINQDAARNDDMDRLEPFRRYAQYWLAGDELKGERALSRKNKLPSEDLGRQIQDIYAQAATREDVENIELQNLDPVLCTPFLRNGMQVHMPYTVYAHWFLLHRLLAGAGVTQVQANMDIDSMSRAAFLCAFGDEVKRGDAHGFYVRYTKFQTIDERRQIMEESRRRRAAFRKTLPEELQRDPEAVSQAMMQAQFAEGTEYGKWKDVWYEHPLPTMNEPNKGVSALTPLDGVLDDRKADLFLRAGLARIDNVFQITRRLINAFERPIGTPSGQNAVWHGYAPYNPEMVQTYLTIFRVVNNFILVGEDGKTPAMRLGITKKPLEYEDILWPGQRVPRPKRNRRKGMKAVA